MASSTQVEIPELGGYSAPYNPEDWEDWLRWDPSAETSSPHSSTNHSGDSIFQDGSPMQDSLDWMKESNTINPALMVGGDESILNFNMDLGSSAIDFANQGQAIDPYIFGSEDMQVDSKVASAAKRGSIPWPTVEAQDASLQTAHRDSLLPNAAHTKGRRISSSTVNTESIASQQHSPASQVQAYSSMSSLSPQPAAPPKKKPGRKRKSEMPGAEGSVGADGEPPVKKTSHNVIEKRYRNNLNDKIIELRDSVPSLRAMSKPNGEEDDSEDLEGLTAAHKLNKSTIMAKATEYIRHLEKRNKTMSDDMVALKNRIRTLEHAFARSNAVSDHQSNSATSSVVNRARQQSIHNDTSLSASPTEQLRRQSIAHQSSIADSSIDDIVDRPQNENMEGNNSNLIGKLMLGSMAGMMAMEGFFEGDQNGQSPGTRGLSAAPVGLFRRGMSSPSSGSAISGMASQAMIPLVKFSLLLACAVYLILPLLKSSPKKKKTTIPQITLTAAPSLASPVETRRKAWSTAIQSVWTPRPFLLEVVAVGIRMAELSARGLVGFDRYSELLGMTKDDEAARIKAWDIAIDAQLAGGDAEVSYYRLLLTLMASGTLPDSPIRLMQKAVHFRIFFWEVANAGYGNMFMFKSFTAKVARKYWDLARTQQKALVSGNASKVDELDHAIELLPDHLAALIELECDEVLTDHIIQRAYNLAWNRPSAENTVTSTTLDKVVEDPAIRSPLDAVAAWFTNTVVDEALALSIHSAAEVGEDVGYLVDLAAKTAPPASSTLTRAYVAKAVLMDQDRESNIVAALESMPHVPLASPMLGRSPTTNHLNVVTHVPLTPEVRTALTLAKLLSICDVKNPASSQSHAATVLDNVALRSAQFTLLTAVAAHKLLDACVQNPLIFSQGKDGLEQLAFNLRLWIGTRAGKAGGLNRMEKGRIIDRCLAVTRRIGGWRDKDEVDSGYDSSSASRRSSEVMISA